ncbi:MAG: hypothetical protein RLZZ618_221 [Pseudomonadota bacterium]|jgi:hypothetical protein
MFKPEILILCMNLTMMLIAYFFIYPRFCGSDGMKIVNNDIIITSVVLLISGYFFWGSGQVFSMIWFSANWFWFTLSTCMAIEIPFMLWYFKKHNVWESFKF